MAIVDPTQYTLVPYKVYGSLQEKLEALLRGEILLVKNFEQNEGSDVLVRLEQKKFTVTQITYDITETEYDPRYWITFNVGLNDLSLFTTLKFEEEIFSHTNKFNLNDIVNYVSDDGFTDSAIIEEVYVSNTDPSKYAYKLSRDGQLYEEEDLVQHRYM